MMGLGIGMNVPVETEQNNEFVRYDQYNPEYMDYTDGQMLKLCEHHELTYNYEDGECV